MAFAMFISRLSVLALGLSLSEESFMHSLRMHVPTKGDLDRNDRRVLKAGIT